MPEPHFLHDATVPQLIDAVAHNHREFFVLRARAAGGEVHETDSVSWTYAGPTGEAMVLFPRWSKANAGDGINEVVRSYLERRPEKLVGLWALDPPEPLILADLDARLLARGFQPGWRPNWMALDLERMETDHPIPDGLIVEPSERDLNPAIQGLPYDHAEEERLRAETRRLQPERIFHFVARLDGKVVGRSSVMITDGPLGVGGIYGVGVLPEAQKKGIGKAVTVAACQQAKSLGYRYALMNGTGRRMYEQIGFRTIGEGQTWWLNVPRLAANLPTRERIALAEAVARGNCAALDALERSGAATDLDAPTANGMTLLQLAVHSQMPVSAEWLIAQGATLDLLSAWDLGWKDRAVQLLNEQPGLANERMGDMKITPLHEAVQRNDPELARVALEANPDLEIQDAAFHSTPLGWARHFGNTEIEALILSHQERERA